MAGLPSSPLRGDSCRPDHCLMGVPGYVRRAKAEAAVCHVYYSLLVQGCHKPVKNPRVRK